MIDPSEIHEVASETGLSPYYIGSLLPPERVCGRYVDYLSKWIKRHPHIRTFRGTPGNAVKAQIRVASSTYAPVAIIKKRLGLDISPYALLQVLSITLLKKSNFRNQPYF